MSSKFVIPVIISLILVTLPTVALPPATTVGRAFVTTDYKGRINIVLDTDDDGFADDIWQFLAATPIEFSLSDPLMLEDVIITYERDDAGGNRFTIESDEFEAVLSVRRGPVNWASLAGSTYQIGEGLEFVHRGTPDDKNYGLLFEAAQDAANYPSIWDSRHDRAALPGNTYAMGTDEDRCQIYDDCDCTAGGHGSTSCHKTCIFLMECDVSCGPGQFSCCYCSLGAVPVCRCRDEVSIGNAGPPKLIPGRK